jgi:hypothetical protein
MIYTNSYYPDVLLNEMRTIGDPTADAVIEHLFREGQTLAVNQLLSTLDANTQLLPSDLPDPVRQYLETTAHLPEWADRKAMKRGHAFFSRHAEAIMSTLGSLSLPYCYAAADGAQVLLLSLRMRYDVERRLTETNQFMLDVMDSQAFEPKGKGFRSIQKVRLMHAAIRFHILKSGKWNQAWGHPINQEDMAGTNQTFSYIPLEGLTKLGIVYSLQEAEDFLHLWNVIGYLLGVDAQILPSSMNEAFWFDKQIQKRHFRESEAGIELTKALVDFLVALTPQSVARDFIPSFMRYLLSDPVADLLHLPHSNWTHSFLGPIKVANFIQSMLKGFKGSHTSDLSKAIYKGIDLQREKVLFQTPLRIGGLQ